MDDARLEALEVKCAWLEEAVQDMSDVMVAQQRELDRLRARHSDLLQRLERVAADLDTDGQPESEKPPHY